MNSEYEFSSWYQSTQGQQISATVKAIVGLAVLPTLKSLFGLEFGPEWVDGLIEIGFQLGFSVWALYGYVRAKRTQERQIGALRSKVEDLGGSLE